MRFVNIFSEVKNSRVMLDIQASVYKDFPLQYLSEEIILKSSKTSVPIDPELYYLCHFYKNYYKTLFVEEELKF